MLYSFYGRRSAAPNLVLSLSGAICNPIQRLDASFLNHSRPLYALQLVSSICQKTLIIYLPSARLRDQWVDAIRLASGDFDLTKHYHISRLMYSSPRCLISCGDTNSTEQYMLSFLDKSLVQDVDLNALRIESGILRFSEEQDIAPAVEFFEDQDKLYFIQQISNHWVRLDEIIAVGGILSVNSVGLIMRQVISCLSSRFDHHVNLGVLCPASILICSDNLSQHRIQIVDICLRKYFLSHLDPDAQIYAAPEVEKGRHIGAKAHMWSVGAIIYRLLTPGSTPANLTSAQHGQLDLTHTLGSKSVIALLKRLLSVNPSRRFCPAVAMSIDFITNAVPRRFEVYFPKRVFNERYYHYHLDNAPSRSS